MPWKCEHERHEYELCQYKVRSRVGGWCMCRWWGEGGRTIHACAYYWKGLPAQTAAAADLSLSASMHLRQPRQLPTPLTVVQDYKRRVALAQQQHEAEA